MRAEYLDWLLDVTSLPTAAGCEGHVITWVKHWLDDRPSLQCRSDRYGNLLISRRDASRSSRPIIFTAHMDHPAFVAERVAGGEVEAAFRGGVRPNYFPDARVMYQQGQRRWKGRITAVDVNESQRSIRATMRFAKGCPVGPGEVITWDLPRAQVRKGRVHAPACDDLAAVVAALALLEERHGETHGDVRVLLTRAEEVGFIGAMAACRSKLIPAKARVIALENSKSLPNARIGDGPIVRVGDRTSTFHPELTHRICQVAQRMQDDDAAFVWQRKLMDGGTCEATAFCAYGYDATCICLPLGNYHNMNDSDPDRLLVASEVISVDDFHGLVRLMVGICRHLDDVATLPPLRARLDETFDRWSHLLDEA